MYLLYVRLLTSQITDEKKYSFFKKNYIAFILNNWRHTVRFLCNIDADTLINNGIKEFDLGMAS